MNKDYIPYGKEWEKELMKLPKKFLIELLRKAYTYEAPFPDKMTFQQMYDTLFKRDFLRDEEFQTICDAAEMYANGCIRTYQMNQHENN